MTIRSESRRERARKYQREFYKRNKNAKKAYTLKYRYGITQEKYHDMLDDQEGLCALCSRGYKGRSLGVDHDHETGEVRGLLCNRCNSCLSWFENCDFPKTLRYLGLTK